ncbi:MAG: exodeoxyribonuclease VII small subunit [Thermoanaerobaculia bacterium]|nr:exodeoxyribonuclease VII small subunit [Thermoanaerobaculia bacterium]
MSQKPKSAPPEPAFAAALAELEQILLRIEREEVDVDRLAAELERAAVLVELCRGKLRRAELEVEQIVQRLEEPAAPAAE